MDDARPRRRGRRQGTYVDEDHWRRLSDDTVALLLCLKIWQTSGIITIDKSLFERSIEAVAVAEC